MLPVQLLAAALAGLAALCAVPARRTSVRLARLGLGPARGPQRVPRRGVVTTGVLLLGALTLALRAGPGLGLIALGTGALLLRRRRVVVTVRQAGQERAATLTACSVLAAELRAGAQPSVALRAAAGFAEGETARWLGAAAACEAVGGEPADVLRGASGPAADELRHLGACWRVSSRTGAGLAVAVDRLGAGLRARADLDEELASALTAPRATARLLAGLPLLGVLLGTLLGADPLHVLTATPLGLGCLLVGGGLDLAGLALTDRLVRRAQRRAGVLR